MRNLIGALGVVLLLGSAPLGAMAADLPLKAPPLPVAPVYNWTGCYIGGNVGGGTARQDQFRLDQIGVGPSPAAYGHEGDSAFVGGGQVGCDWNFAPNGLIGIQGQFDGGRISGSHALPAFPTFTMFDKTTSFDTVTVRAGWIIIPQLLGYLKGGVAFTRTSDFLNQPSGALSESAAWTRTGGTFGAGLEYMFAPGWSVFGEYNILDFGRSTVTFNAAPGNLPVGEHVTVDTVIQNVLVGVNYKFNWGAPLVAKY